MRIESLKLVSGKKLDPMSEGFYPVAFFGTDQVDNLDYWLVSTDDKQTVKEQAASIMNMIDEIKRLRKELQSEKSRTDMLNFGQHEPAQDINKALEHFENACDILEGLR